MQQTLKVESVNSKIISVLILLLSLVNEANANIVDLGIAQSFNLFAINDIVANANDVQGAVAAGGNVTVTNYAINSVNTAGYAGDALVVGGNLNISNSYIGQGNAYVGGTTTTSGLGFAGSFISGIAPFSFANAASSLYQLSATLAGLASNGLAAFDPWGGAQFTGDGTTNTQVFNVSGSQLLSINYLTLANVTAGQTLIFNVTGNVGGFNAAGIAATLGYNVLFNFSQATQIALNNVGVFGSVLAPYATAIGAMGQINGNVAVNNWFAGIQINSSGLFNGANIGGSVPVPGTLALLLPMLGMLIWMHRRQASSLSPLKRN